MNEYYASPGYGAPGMVQSAPPNPAVLVVFLLVGLAFYIYFAYSLMTIAKKTNTGSAWMAWVPIVNIFLMLMIAKKPMWWFLLLLIPLVNIVISIIVWMKIAQAVGKPDWLGILMIVPIANIIIPGYLAFSSSTPPMAPTPMPPSPVV